MASETSGVYVALGANLPSEGCGTPRETLEAALAALADAAVPVLRRSSWWRSAPQPAADQPDFVNGAVEVAATLGPAALLDLLHRIEANFGRVRRQRWEARVLDLDLIDYQGQVAVPAPGQAGPLLPHPRMTERLFVLLPLQEIAPGWRHPVSGIPVGDLIEKAESLKINKL
jgi:2-amino-4-hydroxy-6-hydroxymethyldihydropteridine diphosphokinase